MLKPKERIKVFQIQGIDCPGCATMLESELENSGIEAKCSFTKQTLTIQNFNSSNINKIRRVITESGCKIAT